MRSLFVDNKELWLMIEIPQSLFKDWELSTHGRSKENG